MLNLLKVWLESNKVELKSVLNHAVMISIATGTTYLLGELPNLHLGSYAPILTAVLSVVIKIIQKFA